MTMSSKQSLEFGPPLIGQTEKALDAILARELDGSGVSVSGWVLLKLATSAGESVGRQELVGRADAVSKFGAEEAEIEVDALVRAGMLDPRQDELVVSPKARILRDRVQSAVGEVTTRLWGDLPATDLAAAGRVLGTVLRRANAELGYSI
jgi:hypothetical protein